MAHSHSQEMFIEDGWVRTGDGVVFRRNAENPDTFDAFVVERIKELIKVRIGLSFLLRATVHLPDALEPSRSTQIKLLQVRSDGKTAYVCSATDSPGQQLSSREAFSNSSTSKMQE